MYKRQVYDRASLNLSEEEKNQHISEGRKPYWRFKLSGKKNIFHDLVRGEVSVDTSAQSDPVVVRGMEVSYIIYLA